MSTTLSPFVFWAQSESNVFIKVDLQNVKDHKIKLEKRKLHFEATGLGAQGLHNYSFQLEFHSNILLEESNYKVYDSKVDFNIVKEEKKWWPRLISQPQKPAWLKIDFDRWQSEEDINDSEERLRDVRDDYADLYKKLQREELGYTSEDVKKVYLLFYNLLMFVGFLYIYCVVGIRFLKDGLDSIPGTYSAVGSLFCVVQLMMCLEIVHPLIGLTSGGVFTPILQVLGRNLILFTLIYSEPRMQTKSVIFYLFVAWSSIELVRYPYYMTQLYKMEIPVLTYLRYTLWMVLLPIGLTCEALTIFLSIPYVEETGRFTVTLPNMLNFTFHFATFLRILLLFFMIPIGYTLMSHLYKARCKKLGKKNWQKTK